MALDINKYVKKNKKKRNFFNLVALYFKIYIRKFIRNEALTNAIGVLFGLGCVISAICFYKNLLLFMTAYALSIMNVIIAISIIFIGIFLFFFIELGIDNKQQNENKINFKRGFNRLSVFVSVVITIISLVCTFTFVLESYNDANTRMTKFYDIKTKDEITDICGNYFNIKEINKYYVTCEPTYEDKYTLVHNKDIIIKLPNKIAKNNDLAKNIYLYDLNLLLYLLLRLVYFVLFGILNFIFSGFKN